MGILMVIGIAVSNGILLVDDANRRFNDEGADKVEAVVAAARSRFVPIAMTSLATVIGLIPTAMGLERGSEANQPLALAVVGGLTSSTLLSLFLVPVMFIFFAKKTLTREERSRTECAARRSARMTSQSPVLEGTCGLGLGTGATLRFGSDYDRRSWHVPTPKRVIARARRGLVVLAVDEVWAFEARNGVCLVHCHAGQFHIEFAARRDRMHDGEYFCTSAPQLACEFQANTGIHTRGQSARMGREWGAHEGAGRSGSRVARTNVVATRTIA